MSLFGLEEPNIVLVCGGRHFKMSDREFIFDNLTHFHRYTLPIEALVHGFADGADRLAGVWAHSMGIPEIMVPANWDHYNKAAGPVRNGWMLRFIRVQHVIAFPGKTGTADMMYKAHKAGIKVTKIDKK